MIIKALILTAFLTNDPIIIAMPPVKTEARKRNGKNNRDRRRGAGGLR
tara:strand:- start:328 stop:471 length:144 start_codon:yes stop_codon:yes gene_type:complete